MTAVSQEQLPHLYSPFEHPSKGLRYKSAGIATEVGATPQLAGSIALVEMRSPGSLVLPQYSGDQLSRDEAFSKGAVMALDRASGIIAGRSVDGLATPEEEALFDRAAQQAADDHQHEMNARNGGEFPRGEFAFR